jgi:hypothetical protein
MYVLHGHLHCESGQVAPAWFLEVVDNQMAEGIGYADSTSNQMNVVGNQDYGCDATPAVHS